MIIIVKKINQLLGIVILFLKHIYVEFKQYYRILIYQKRYSTSSEVLLANLRVIAHALDKGLNAPNRQDNRGYERYESCRTLVQKLEQTNLSDDPTLKWACKIINQYERRHDDGHNNKKGYSISLTPEERNRLINVIQTRRSVRNFTAQVIDQNILADIIDIARWAPNSCCRQSVFFYVTENQGQIKKCIAITPGATCFSNIIPCFICVCGDIRFYPLIDKNLLYIDGALAAENLLLAAHAYGIGGTILNWRQHMRSEERYLKEILNIEPFHTVVFNIALGYPEIIPTTPARKHLNAVWKMRGKLE